MDSGNGPSRLFRLRFKRVKVVKYRISGGIVPERFRRERSSELICGEFGWHLTPDQVHQIGSWRLVFGFQFWNVWSGSLSLDLRERRETSWIGGGGSSGRGDDGAERAREVSVNVMNVREKKSGTFMVVVVVVLLLLGLGLRSELC